MPLIHIYHPPAKPAYLAAISDGLHEALLETWAIPEKDRFQIFHETPPTALQIDKEMWDVQRSDDVVVFHVFTSPRSEEMKLAFYERLPEILADKAGLRPEDVFISCSSNERSDWSFGNGRAQLLDVDAGLLDHLSPALGGKNSAPAAAMPSVGGGGGASAAGKRSLSTLAATRTARRPLSSVAAAAVGAPPHVPVGGSALSKIGLVAACGASAFFGATMAAQQQQK